MKHQNISLAMIGLAIVSVFVSVMFAVTDGFAGSTTTQNMVASSDVVVQQTAPGINNDITERYLPGAIWIDQTGGAVYVAEDTTNGAAVWTDITAGGSTFNAEELDVLVASNVAVLDAGLGIDFTESPAGEINVTIDYLEDPVDLATGEVTGTLDLSDHVNLAAGTGATLTGDTLSVDLGTAIDTSEITDATILEADLKVVDAPADEECFTYEATGGDFEWQACASGGSGTLTTIKEGGIAIGDPDIVSLDFGAGIDCTESPDTEINCNLDYTEDPVNLASGEVTGTLAAGNGGTGQTAATADAVLVGNGSAYVARAITDCDAAGNALQFDITTDAWSCATGYLTTVDISDNTNLAAGTNITLVGDTLNVDDAFIQNTGDTGTGAFDFGGATDFEIPNSATQSPNAAGEVAVDTTDDQVKYYGAAERVITYRHTKSVVIEDPADADNFLLWKAAEAITITDIECIVDPADTAESVVIDIQERTGTGDTPATVDATITCDNDGAADDGTLTNGAIDAGDWISIDIGTVTGTVTQVVVTITFVIDAA